MSTGTNGYLDTTGFDFSLLNDILSDPDWRAWLTKPKDKHWTGRGYLYETETDLGFAPGITLPYDFPWPCESQRVKVTLERIGDGKTEAG